MKMPSAISKCPAYVSSPSLPHLTLWIIDSLSSDFLGLVSLALLCFGINPICRLGPSLLKHAATHHNPPTLLWCPSRLYPLPAPFYSLYHTLRLSHTILFSMQMTPNCSISSQNSTTATHSFSTSNPPK